jgi:hypothetical protein
VKTEKEEGREEKYTEGRIEGINDGRGIFLFCFFLLRTVWLLTSILPFLDCPFFLYFFRDPPKTHLM